MTAHSTYQKLHGDPRSLATEPRCRSCSQFVTPALCWAGSRARPAASRLSVPPDRPPTALRPWLDGHTVQHRIDSGERTATRLSDEPGLHLETLQQMTAQMMGPPRCGGSARRDYDCARRDRGATLARLWLGRRATECLVCRPRHWQQDSLEVHPALHPAVSDRQPMIATPRLPLTVAGSRRIR